MIGTLVTLPPYLCVAPIREHRSRYITTILRRVQLSSNVRPQRCQAVLHGDVLTVAVGTTGAADSTVPYRFLPLMLGRFRADPPHLASASPSDRRGSGGTVLGRMKLPGDLGVQSLHTYT